MQRYTVTIVAPGAASARPVLLVPFQPSAIVTAFIDELYRRIARRGLNIAPNTHVTTLHLDSETGAIIDCEDSLSDVVSDPRNEQLFAVFTEQVQTGATSSNSQTAAQTTTSFTTTEAASLSVRVVTPSTAKNRDACPVFQIPLSATIRQLHERIAGHLQISPNFDDHADSNECNCKLANQLSNCPSPANQFLVVHGKSVVERLQLSSPTEGAVKESLRRRLGQDFELTKRVALVGADVHNSNANLYKKTPVAAVCSKQHHTPVHARVDIDETGHRRSKVLDLHTSELPIHPACMDATFADAGLQGLAIDGMVDIFAINRTTTGQNAVAIGKSSIFRARAHWEPSVSVPQSDRGIAMFLSSLRVFASLVQDMKDDERCQDAVLHVFDLLTKFPPALRTLNILVQGKTPTAIESAALSQAMFEVLNSFVPLDVVGSDHARVFEGSRLFFGFVLEKARTLKLSVEEGATLPYLNSLQTMDLRDHKTGEAVMYAIYTSHGLVEAKLFESFEEGALLAGTYLQSNMVKTDIDPTIARLALLSGGAVSDITVLSLSELHSNYRYRDSGDVNAALDLDELSELSHLAELCGRNKLAVHKPSQLSSAVAPCLTFDRNAHLAVYTGEQPCGEPGHSSILSRPQHGDETIDAGVIEQLIAPILQGYEADGTAVFDALGGAAVRRLQAPDEILMFCVDCSASMRQATDFSEVNESNDFNNPDDQVSVESEFYNRASFDDMKERLCDYEGFEDMIAIVAGTDTYNRRRVTSQVIDILRTMLSFAIVRQSETIETRRSGRYHARQQVRTLQAELDKMKSFWAGLKTHEQPVCDFLIYRATSASTDISQRWSWTLGDAIPAAAPLQNIPSLAADITELPDHLRCPISHTLMEDAASAADGHTYSESAISQWFSIRSSSPMTGLQLLDTSLQANRAICDAAARWVHGDDIPGRDPPDEQPSKRARANELEVTFDSRVGSFTRTISSAMNLKDLYKLAFHGLKARVLVFQLSTERYGPLAPTPEATVSSRNIRNGDHINVRIAEDDPMSTNSTAVGARQSGDRVLIKVYHNKDDMLFGYWVKRDNTQTMSSVLWKYWRYMFQNSNFVYAIEKQVWTDLEDSGDGLLRGTPILNTEMLATYLNRSHCFGHLGPEKVYKSDTASNRMNFDNQPLVLKVQVMLPWKRREERNRLTRLDVLKQMFEALINRMSGYNYKTHVGLITFASTPKVTMGISHVLENFRRATNDMNAEGDTAIWDALALAKDQLVEYGKKFPEAKKRIICISDGEDTKSTSNTPQDICWRLGQAEIATDTISLGDEDNLDLRTLSHLLGCYTLHPTSLVNALAICEMEPCLSLAERPPISPPPGLPRHRLQFMGHFWTARGDAKYTVVTADRVPPRKEHPNMHDGFVQLNSVAARANNTNSTGNTRSNLRISRLMNEIRSIAANSVHPKYDVYVSETDMTFWKIVMDGPDDSPYADGAFLLYLHADEGYPTFAPKARFITKIKHPNINAHGRICHSIFDRDYTSDLSMTTLLDSVYGLLLQPEHSDPVNTTSTLSFHHDQVEFFDETRDYVDRHAFKTREDWKKILLGEEEDYEVSSEPEDEDEDEDMDEDMGEDDEE